MYRQGVGVVVFNKEKKVLALKRVGNFAKGWQFVQGGIDDNETSEQAAIRELNEETSIKSVKLVKKLEEKTRYDFSDEAIADLQKKLSSDIPKGQEHTWFLFQFVGNDEEINLDTKEKEFQEYRWVDADFIAENIVGFKKDAYITAIAKLLPYIKNYEIKS